MPPSELMITSINYTMRSHNPEADVEETQTGHHYRDLSNYPVRSRPYCLFCPCPWCCHSKNIVKMGVKNIAYSWHASLECVKSRFSSKHYKKIKPNKSHQAKLENLQSKSRIRRVSCNWLQGIKFQCVTFFFFSIRNSLDIPFIFFCMSVWFYSM